MQKKNNSKQDNCFNFFRLSVFNQRAFTLIELLLVVSITLILVAAVSPVYGNLQASAQLNSNSSLIVQTIRIAGKRSDSGLNNKNHGVYFRVNASGSKDKFVLYQGDSYGARDSSFDREYYLDEPLHLGLPGASTEFDLNFASGTGVPDSTATIVLSHKVEGSKKITINELGLVEEGE